MLYTIDPHIFEQYPHFRRAVLVARNVDNSQEVPEVLALLRESEAKARSDDLENFKDHPRLAVWAQAFRSMGLNPNKYPPSVINLIKRTRKGTDLPYVNTLVALFNCVSLRHLIPCGGDNLDVVTGDLHLGFASGEESYTPLGQPDVQETPPVGEVIYMDTGTKDVFCRTWCWKNGDRSKLLPDTRWAAINVDMQQEDADELNKPIAEELAQWVRLYTGGDVEIHYLGPAKREFSVT